MFDIAWSELLLIGAVALVVIGPKDLPKALRTVGQVVGKVRRMAADFQGQFNDAMREAELHDLKKQVEDIGGSVQAATKVDFDPIGQIRTEFESKDEPKSEGLDDAALKEADAKLAALPLPDLPPPVEIAPSEVAEPAPEEKPKRRRKPKAETETAAAEPEPAPVAVEETPKPARKRRTKAAASGEGSEA